MAQMIVLDLGHDLLAMIRIKRRKGLGLDVDWDLIATDAFATFDSMA